MTEISYPQAMAGLTPSTIQGAYLSPPPPPGFDPQTAGAADLLKYGAAGLRAGTANHSVMDEHVRRVLAGSGQFVPEQVARPEIVHRPVRRQINGTTREELTNWGGGVLGGNWAGCVGTWTVPTVSKPQEAAGADGGWNSASWVGLDGYGSNDVLQAGIAQNVDAQGNASYSAWYEWYCAIQKRTLGDTSPMHPALASLNGRLYIAWLGNDNHLLNVMMSSDRGQSFSGKYVSNELSTSPIALCAHQGMLMLAWTGMGNDQLNVAQVTLDGNGVPTAIANKLVLGDISPDGPSLASLGTGLYLGWLGKDNEQINISVSTDGGHSFGAKHVSSETTPHTPALAAVGLHLFVAWRGDGNDQLNVAKTTFAGAAVTSLVDKVVLGDTSPFGPSIAGVGSDLYLAWRGDGNDQLNMMVSHDAGASFTGKVVSAETSTDAPVLTPNGSDLFIGWRGDGNDNLNVALVGMAGGVITGFSTPGYLGAVTIPNFPVKPGDVVSCAVAYAANGAAGQVSFTNVTTGHAFPITLLPPPGADMKGTSGEWVMEVPTINGTLSHLPAFTPVTFTGAATDAANGGLGDPNAGITMTIDNDNSIALTNTVLGDKTVSVSYHAAG